MTALAAIEGANPATGAASYYTHDHLGSTRGVYGAAGEVLASVGYGPYGAPGMHNAGAAPAFSYTGKPYDDATGLYHFPYRQYDPNAARWLTRDPLGMFDGPNVYAYVMGNPVGAVDPLGLIIEDSLEQIGSILPCIIRVMGCFASGGSKGYCIACLSMCIAEGGWHCNPPPSDDPPIPPLPIPLPRGPVFPPVPIITFPERIWDILIPSNNDCEPFIA